jgi:adenylate kinase
MRHYTFPINAILLLGPTGAGKSPLGDALACSGLFGRSCHHLDFGSELRTAVSDAECAPMYTTDERDFIHGVLERGLLLENEHFPIARKIISLFLDRVGFLQDHLLVLNGIPRHDGQAADIATIAHVHSLVILDCSAEDIYCRIQENTGGDRTGRSDDHCELIEKKLVIFRERTAPLIDHYKRAGCNLYHLRVLKTMTPAEAYRRLSSLAAADPPVALVAEPPHR